MMEFNTSFLFVSYRDWGTLSYGNLSIPIPRVCNTHELVCRINTEKELKYIFFVGWSEIIPDEIIKNYQCFCIHPSDLPKYRGGSPIQNQIIEGVTKSVVSLFRMDEKLDHGPIVSKSFLSLEGSLDDIFTRIGFISAYLINDLISRILIGEEISLLLQDETEATLYKRRKPSESEITINDLINLTSTQLLNKIRSLADPYPNAYIICSDGRKLQIKKASIE